MSCLFSRQLIGRQLVNQSSRHLSRRATELGRTWIKPRLHAARQAHVRSRFVWTRRSYACVPSADSPAMYGVYQFGPVPVGLPSSACPPMNRHNT